MKGRTAIKNNSRIDIIEVAKKKRHIHLLEKTQSGKITKKELEELKEYEEIIKPKKNKKQNAKPNKNIVSTIPQVAQALKCSARTIRNWKGEGMPVRPDRTYDLRVIRVWRADRDNRRKPAEIEELDNAIKKEQLKQLEIKNQQQIGLLILKKDAERAGFEAARTTRDAMLAIPDRICGILAAETDIGKIRKILIDEVTSGLNKLADS